MIDNTETVLDSVLVALVKTLHELGFKKEKMVREAIGTFEGHFREEIRKQITKKMN